jgi:urate oxidase
MIRLADNQYGKSRVRLVRVKRDGEKHHCFEWTVDILLKGDFESCFKEGDNSKILTTDAMKNTIYSLARDSSASCMEEFAKELIDFLLGRNPQVSQFEVTISDKPWEQLVIGGKPHPTSFVHSSQEHGTTNVRRAQGGQFQVASGLDNLVVMKTAQSGFEGYIRDSLTTRPATDDRLLGTIIRADWIYTRDDLPFALRRTTIRETMLAVFAMHESKSVQHTLYAMGEAVLERVPEVEEIALIMPNLHCLLVDLSRFGQTNPNEIFVPTDEPHGYMEARICRNG